MSRKAPFVARIVGALLVLGGALGALSLVSPTPIPLPVT